MLAAVKDFAYTYNDDSVRNNAEYGSTVYKYADSSGKTEYSYTVPNKGGDGGSSPSAPSDGQAATGYIHTHGAYAPSATTKDAQYDYNIPSPADQKFADKTGLPVYTVGPAGGVNKFDPKTDQGGYNVGTFINKDWNDVPKDPRDLINPKDTNTVNLKDHSHDDPYQTGAAKAL
jgi:hypothetical protein